MLGEQLGELKGKTTGRRVQDVTNGPTFEVSVSREGKLKGVEVSQLLTYSATRASDGAIHGHGQGVIMTKDGSETVAFMGAANGHFTGPANISYRGIEFYGMSKGKLGFLNNLAVVFEVEDNIETLSHNIKMWEWK